MAPIGLFSAALVSALCAASWGYVGARLRTRELPAEHRAAGKAFAYSWVLGGAYGGVNALLALAFAVGPPPTWLGLAGAWLSALLGVAMLGLLMAYLAHLLTGSARALPIVLTLYAAQLMLLVAVIVYLQPRSAISTGWTVRFDFARASVTANAILAILFIVPVALASLGYLSAYSKATTPTARWRILLVGGSLALWLLAALITRSPVVPNTAIGVARVASGFGAIGVFIAYVPPAWARARFSVEGLPADPAPHPWSDPARAKRKAALEVRLRDLI